MDEKELEKLTNDQKSIFYKSEFKRIGISSDFEVKLNMDKVPIISFSGSVNSVQNLEEMIMFCLIYNKKCFESKDLQSDMFISFKDIHINPFVNKELSIIDLIKTRIRRFSRLGKVVIDAYVMDTNSGMHYNFSNQDGFSCAEMNFCFYKMDNNEIFETLDLLVEDKILKKINKFSSSGERFLFKPLKSSFYDAKKSNNVFIICEFDDEYSKYNKDYLIPLIQKYNLIPTVMNETGLYGNIDLAIKNNIMNAKFIIANISSKKGWNPNVFYEMGLAKAYGKEMIMILDDNHFDENIKNLPFDINSHTCINYTKFPEKLESAIEMLSK